jgi:hypothetical protein
MKRARLPLILLLILAGTVAIATPELKADVSAVQQTIRGKVTCVDASRDECDCSIAGSRYAIRSAGGRIYLTSKSDPMAEVFADPRVRERDLQVTGRPGSAGTIELIKVQSIRHGRVYDIYYFCDVCNVTTNTMGSCPCCGKDMEFKETLAE